MKLNLLFAASALALAPVSVSALAQMNMRGMKMPMSSKPTAKKPSVKKEIAVKDSTKKTLPRKVAPKKGKATRTSHEPVQSSSSTMPGKSMPMKQQGMQMHSHSAPVASSQMPMGQSQMHQGTMTMPSSPAGSVAQTMPMDRQQMGHGQVGQMDMPMGGHDAHEMNMTGALGSYPMERESSGTAWQPDSSEHVGLMSMSGDWTLMAHGVVNFVYDHQSGLRGDDKAFANGMLMGMARRPLGNGTLEFRAMVSPDPLMGPSGYPLLLASGETANGRDRLIDRQHPHDFFMELSGSISQSIGEKSSVFVYAGLPGEPAFGPPAFMHREAILDSPEAPISHHWLDSTHISFGVVTTGLVLDRFKLEVSRFNGREPDQHRWNIETGPLDSTAVRLSWNPTRTVALQGSWGYFKDPEQLEPGVNQRRWSASALWSNEIAPGWKAAATLAWGRKSTHGHNDDALVAEASLKRNQWTMFGRGEMIENRELIQGRDQPAYRVGKVSFGALRDFSIAHHLSLGAGGLVSVNFVPDQLAALYGGHNPTGAMAFVRLKLH